MATASVIVCDFCGGERRDANARANTLSVTVHLPSIIVGGRDRDGTLDACLACASRMATALSKKEARG